MNDHLHIEIKTHFEIYNDSTYTWHAVSILNWIELKDYGKLSASGT